MGQLDAQEFARITARPKIYGFHATLKAPFRLKTPIEPSALSDTVAGIAARFDAFETPPLEVRSMGGFLALTPGKPCAAMDDLAAACTIELDKFRAPLSPPERARRKPETLSPRQRQYLDTWGYPYVFEEFRWHMTLTDPVSGETAGILRRHLWETYRRLCGRTGIAIDGLSLMCQTAPNSRFQLVERYPLRTSA